MKGISVMSEYYRYRYVTYKKNKNNEWKVENIAYASRLNYSKEFTGVDTSLPINTYRLRIDRNLGKDDTGKYIYENDVIKDEVNNKVYSLERRSTGTFLIEVGTNYEQSLYSAQHYPHIWHLISNIYNK